jgi:hypothetical protein
LLKNLTPIVLHLLLCDHHHRPSEESAATTSSGTGFYAGLNVGGGWAKSDWFEDASGSGGGGPLGFQDASINASGVPGSGLDLSGQHPS